MGWQMSLVFLYSVLHPCKVWAYCERAASLTGTKPHAQSLVREDGKGTEGKYWTLEHPQSWDYDLTPALTIVVTFGKSLNPDELYS